MINNKNNKETAPANPLPESKSASTRAPRENVFAPPNPRQSLGLGRPAGSAGLAKTVQPEAPPTPSDIELVIRYSRALESLLGKRLGATGTGLHERITSVEKRLPVPLVKRLRWIATMRNNVVHVDGFVLPSAAEYEAACKKCMEELQAVKVAPKESPVARAARLQAEDQALVHDWLQPIGWFLAGFVLSAVYFILFADGVHLGVLVGLVIVMGGILVLTSLFILGMAPAVWRIRGPLVTYIRTRNAGPLAAAIRTKVYLFAAPSSRACGPTSSSNCAPQRRASAATPAIVNPASGISPGAGRTPDSDNPAMAELEHPSVNPATGLAMLADTSLDIGGNQYGTASASFDSSFSDSSFGSGDDSFGGTGSFNSFGDFP